MAMAVDDLAPGTRVVDLGYPAPQRVWIVDRVVHTPDRTVAECHAEAEPERRARCWASLLAPAPPAAHPSAVHQYQWEDLRDTTAGDLRPGDTILSLGAFQVVHVYKGGRVTGGDMTGMLTPRGTTRTVVARDGNRVTFRNHPDGCEWTAEIKPDHPMLRVEHAQTVDSKEK
ncbi:hypothetical protein JNW88_08180 [Micromonospora sp. ATA32]|nr:hypothetical protein [Micromonospora sp. ATA32]